MQLHDDDDRFAAARAGRHAKPLPEIDHRRFPPGDLDGTDNPILWMLRVMRRAFHVADRHDGADVGGDHQELLAPNPDAEVLRFGRHALCLSDRKIVV